MAINNAQRSFQFWNAVAATPLDFNLDAGVYGVTATVTGTVTLQRLVPDGVGTNYIAVAVLTTGYAVLQLPAGQYRILMAGATITGLLELIARGSG
jgi:hypothetical protein